MRWQSNLGRRSALLDSVDLRHVRVGGYGLDLRPGHRSHCAQVASVPGAPGQVGGFDADERSLTTMGMGEVGMSTNIGFMDDLSLLSEYSGQLAGSTAKDPTGGVVS